MKYVGAILVIAVAFLSSRAYFSYLARRREECEGYVNFLAFMRGRISCFLMPVAEWAGDFSNDALERSGFLPALRECGSLSGAYGRVRKTAALPSEADRILNEFFSSSGKGYLEGELKNIDFCTERLERICDAERTESASRRKLAATLIFALTLGWVILII